MRCSLQNHQPTRRAFTLADFLVTLGIIFLLLGYLPSLGTRAGNSGGRIRCAANLRALAQHGFIYANANNSDVYPRTAFDERTPLDRTSRSANNNIPAALYLLVKTTDLTPEIFVCNEGAAVRMPSDGDLQLLSNWPEPYAKYNSYSYNCPYPTSAAIAAGWKFGPSLGPDYPFASDINPGNMAAGGPESITYTAGRKEMRLGNSPNHWFEGQQVAYCDAHVEWQTSPFAGAQRPTVPFRDNIFVSATKVSPTDGKGGVLWDKPQDAADAVLLPSAQDSPGSAIATRTVDMPVPDRNARAAILESVSIGAGVVLLAVGVVLAFRQRNRRGARGQKQNLR